MSERKYSPPTLALSSIALKARVEEFLEYWEKYFSYTHNFIDSLFADTIPFASIVAASTISPVRQVQPVTGGTTVNTINARSDDMSPLTLLAIDGFSTGTAGNISAVVTLAAGTGEIVLFQSSNQQVDAVIVRSIE